MTSNLKQPRCAIYIRVSTEEQVERARLREQQERLPKIAHERGWSYTLVQDLGVSGQTISGRPGMRHILEMIGSGEVDIVLVIEQSRLTRDTTLEDLGRIIRACQDHSVAIATPERVYRPDDLDDFVMLGIQGVLSAAEVRRFVKRSREGMNRTASEGRYTAGIVPYGYRVDRKGFFFIHEPEAAVVRRMYAWLIDERLTLYQIQRRMNEFAVPPPNQEARSPISERTRGKRTRKTRRRKTSRRWQGFTIRRILTSSFYCGERRYGKRARRPRPLISGPVPALIGRDRFEQAQALVAAARARHRSGQRYDYALSGKIRCSACGHAYSGATDRTVQHGIVRRYVCTNSGRANERGFSCDNPSVRADVLEPLGWQDISDFLTRPQVVLDYFDRQSDEKQKALAGQKEEMDTSRHQRAAIAGDIEQWLDVYPKALSGETRGITADDIDRKIAELRGQLKGLDAHIARTETWSKRLASTRPQELDQAELLAQLSERLKSASDVERSAIVDELVVSIYVEAKRNASGAPIFHYERHCRADGGFWYAHRIPHAMVHIAYAFPEGVYI